MPQLTTLIPSFAAPVTDRVWLVGAHGGAGCTTIRHSDPERFADAGRALPVSQDPSMPSRIILCAMGTGRGLESLRALLADQSAGLFGASILLGAAITDPVPRMPRPARASASACSGESAALRPRKPSSCPELLPPRRSEERRVGKEC